MSDFNDSDAKETQEWVDSVDSVQSTSGSKRLSYLLTTANEHAKKNASSGVVNVVTPYINTIPPEDEEELPATLFDEEKKTIDCIRWNAMLMVSKANHFASELGGHIATYASCAFLYEVGLNHFFKGNQAPDGPDLIFFQGHSSPGLYARAFLEGRITEKQLNNFRRESTKVGLSSYPHPWLMPEFWSFPTVSMGLGPVMAIYQARFLKYLENRKLKPSSNRKVWAFLGDGEMDEPESLGCLSIASREKLDNLIFVVNCNLQRLDGPVRGNGKIIQELEGVFNGAGWNVIKVIWGSEWDKLLEKDKNNILLKRMDEVVDGEYQHYKSRDGAYVRKHFFGKYPELEEMVADWSDQDIFRLRRGGHDPAKIYTAYKKAVHHKNQPTVILVKTIKGYGLGNFGESANVAHSKKKMDFKDLQYFRDRFHLPINDEALKNPNFYRPNKTSLELSNLFERRKALGGFLPERIVSKERINAPSIDKFSSLLVDSGDKKLSTTMGFVRFLAVLMRDKAIKERIIPIVPDEARTFGMEGLFRQIGIYAPGGQLYKPHDADQLLWYREEKSGQVLQEGINETGSMASWIAAATSYYNHDFNTIPFYIFYSMFGAQRVGDLIWAAADMQCRGFLMGATAGRTTLAGEGLQHQDGHSHLFTGNIPNCLSYDPAYAYELVVIILDGIKRMYHNFERVFYYITIMNDNYKQHAMPEGCEQGIIQGMYLLHKSKKKEKPTIQLIGSGAILPEVEQAKALLMEDWGIDACVWSATSFYELRKQAQRCLRWNILHPTKPEKKPYVTEQLKKMGNVPVLAATDYVRMHADQIREFVDAPYHVLGTDGFGRSDTRKALRDFFEVNAFYVTVHALYVLSRQGVVSVETVEKALQKYNINPEKMFSLDC